MAEQVKIYFLWPVRVQGLAVAVKVFNCDHPTGFTAVASDEFDYALTEAVDWSLVAIPVRHRYRLADLELAGLYCIAGHECGIHFCFVITLQLAHQRLIIGSAESWDSSHPQP